MPPSVTCNQKQGLHAIQRPEHGMAGAPREQVHTLLRGESKGFVARGIEFLESLGNAAVFAVRMNRFRGRPPVASIQHTFPDRSFLCRVPLRGSSSLRCFNHSKKAPLDRVHVFQTFQNRPSVGRRSGSSLLLCQTAHHNDQLRACCFQLPGDIFCFLRCHTVEVYQVVGGFRKWI
jgi:hypothetical protein